jgi:protein-disulfide isomerase
LLEKYPEKIKIVFKNFPLNNHKFAKDAAVAALAAHAQGKFLKFHHSLFENRKILDKAKIKEIAKKLDLDMQRFDRDVEDLEIQKKVARDISEGRQAGVRSVPAMFVNGKRFLSRSLEDLHQMIEDELERTQ